MFVVWWHTWSMESPTLEADCSLLHYRLPIETIPAYVLVRRAPEYIRKMRTLVASLVAISFVLCVNER